LGNALCDAIREAVREEVQAAVSQSQREDDPYLDIKEAANTGVCCENVPSVIIRWPQGLGGLPIIFPMGSSAEETEAIRHLLEGFLNNKRQANKGS
jgi:hypothetical protein